MREPQTFYQISRLKQPLHLDDSNDSALAAAKPAHAAQSTGREQEIHLVHRNLAANGSVFVFAEAGIGKTYLVRAVARGWLQTSGLLVQIKFAAESHQMAFRPILDEMAAWATSRSSKQKRSEELVWADLASAQPNLLAHELTTISQIIHRQTHRTEPDQQMNALVLQEKIEQIIHEWLRAVSQQGKLLICLEDVHWIDASSAGLISRMLHQIPNAFWLGTSRQSHSERDQSEQYRAIGWKSCINLLPLNSSAILSILNRQFPDLKISGEVVSDIVRITNGHALFVTHWINEALAKNRYQIAAETLVKTDYRPPNTPNFEDPPISLHFLLQSQFDRLSEEQRFLVQFLSVLNQRIEKNQLVFFFDKHSSFASTLQECLSSQAQILIEYSTDERNSMVAFNHALMRDVAYSSLAMVQRRKFHHEIALGLDAGLLFQSDPLIRGWHWMRSHQADLAVSKAIEAGRYAMAVHSLPQAIQFLSFSLNLLEEKPQLLSVQDTQQLRLLLAFAQSELGKNQADRELLLRTTRSRYSDTPRLWQAVGIIFNHIAHITRSVFGQSKKDIATLNSLSMQATAQLLLAEIAYFQGDIDALQWHAMCSLDASEQSQSHREQSATYGGISLVCARFGLLWLSDRYAAAALRAARRAKDKSIAVDAIPYICLKGIAIADWENTDRRIIQALRRNEKVGHSRRRNELLIIHGYMLELKGNFSVALQRYRECWRTGVERNDQQTKVWGQLGCSRIYLQLGQWSQATQIINEIHNASRYDNVSQLELASQQIILAIVHEQFEKLDDLLLRWPLEDLSKFAQISFAYQGFLTSFLLAVMLKINKESPLECKKKWTRAAVFARSALKLHAAQFPVSRPVRAFMEGLWFANQGKHKRAIQFARRARDEAARWRMSFQFKNSQDLEALIVQSTPINTQLSYFCLAAEELLKKDSTS